MKIFIDKSFLLRYHICLYEYDKEGKLYETVQKFLQGTIRSHTA